MTSTHCFVQVNIVLYHIVYRFWTVMQFLLYYPFFGIIRYFDWCHPFWAKAFFILFYFLLPLITQYLLKFLMHKTSLFSKMYHVYVQLYRLLFTYFEAFFSFFLYISWFKFKWKYINAKILVSNVRYMYECQFVGEILFPEWM